MSATAPATIDATFTGDADGSPDVEVEFYPDAPSGQAFVLVQNEETRPLDADVVGLTRPQAAALAEWILKRLAGERGGSARRGGGKS